jgi:plastocyanin
MSARTTILRTTVLAFVLVSAVGLLPLPVQAGGGCHGGPVIDAAGSAVALKEMCFTPTVIRIQPGESVTWANKDSFEHTVTGVAFTWGSGDILASGKSVTYRFPKAGIYVYACLIHPGMVGAVVVGNGGVPAASGTSSGDSSAVALVASPLAKPKPPAAAAVNVTQSSAGPWKGIALAAVALLVLLAAALAAQRVRTLKTETVQRVEA